MSAPLRLVQFWDSGAPPPEVAALMQTWAGDRAFAWRAYSAAEAAAEIAADHPPRVAAAFERCAVPAMQADFFRYCTLHARGGTWVDADTANGGGLPAMVAGSGRGCLMDRRGKIANDFLHFPAPGDPLLAEVIARAVANIEGEVSNNVWEVTGPGIMTRLYNDPATRPLFAGLRILPVAEVRKVVLFRWNLAYKQGAEDWRAAIGRADRSIFR